jgi:hypothetical protein
MQVGTSIPREEVEGRRVGMNDERIDREAWSEGFDLREVLKGRIMGSG